MNKLTQLETVVLEKSLAGEHPILKRYYNQFKNCRVSRREFTGFWFYTYLDVDMISNSTKQNSALDKGKRKATH
jgi:hypothetical protein